MKASSEEERRVPRTEGGTIHSTESSMALRRNAGRARSPAVRALVKTPSTCMSRPVRASRAAEMRQPSPGDAETAAFAPTR
ncbi:MAG: hypothetical protein ACLUNS_07415 [Alistipes shahii]